MQAGYNNEFYEGFKDSSRLSASVVVPIVMNLVKPKSIIDIGCGIGVWLSVFKEKGVKSIMGVDGPWVDKKLLAIPENCFLAQDISVPFTLSNRADMVVCLEVAEHIPSSAAKHLITTLTSVAPVILFSAAIPHQGGSGHINEQWPEYWATLFKERGFVPVDCLRHKLLNDKRVSWFYSQNMFIFISKKNLPNYPLLEQAVAAGFSMTPPMVHPYKYLYFAERWQLLVPFLGKLPVSLLHKTKEFLTRIFKRKTS